MTPFSCSNPCRNMEKCAFAPSDWTSHPQIRCWAYAFYIVYRKYLHIMFREFSPKNSIEIKKYPKLFLPQNHSWRFATKIIILAIKIQIFAMKIIIFAIKTPFLPWKYLFLEKIPDFRSKFVPYSFAKIFIFFQITSRLRKREL